MIPTETAAADAPSFWRRLEAKLAEPVDLAWLALLRVTLGSILAVSMVRFIAFGWIDEFLVLPQLHFKYWGFHWVEPLARAEMHGVFYALLVLSLAVAGGVLFRITAPLLALGLSYIQLIDVSTYLNHYYLAALLCWLLALSPAGRLWSFDAWRARAAPAAALAPRAWHWLFRVQIGVVYVFAGLGKLQSDWLLHAQPLRIWLGQSTHLPLLGPLLTREGVPLLLSWSGFLFDTTIVGWLSWSRSRPYAYAALLVFHATTSLLFDIGLFPLIMSASALVFFPPSWPRVLLGSSARPLPSPGNASRRVSRVGRWALAAGVAYCAIQVLLPLRHLVYGGDVLWHEQGMRFSWRVMVRAKGGMTTFQVHDPISGQSGEVNPGDYLTPLQQNEMAGQPDLILQLAKRVGHDIELRRGHPVEVRAETRVSLNGRRAVPLIDPAIDLMAVDDGLRPFQWVLPAPGQAPPHTRPVL